MPPRRTESPSLCRNKRCASSTTSPGGHGSSSTLRLPWGAKVGGARDRSILTPWRARRMPRG
eukprot:11719751-Alexandrium_andersonii.AAC.1